MAWTELGVDIVEEISKHLDSYREYVLCRVICKAWKLALPNKQPCKLELGQLPYLILPFEEDNADSSSNTCSMLSLLENKVHRIDKHPEFHEKVIRGSNYGWLAVIDRGLKLHLLDPLSRFQTELPYMWTFPNVISYNPDRLGKEFFLSRFYPDGYVDPMSKTDAQHYYISKAIIFSFNTITTCPNLESDDFIVVAIHGTYSTLAYCKRGDQRWTDVQKQDNQRGIHDAVFHQRMLYAIDARGQLIVSDIITTASSSSKMFSNLVIPPRSISDIGFNRHLYLVSSENGLLLVIRYFMYWENRHHTVNFYVYMLDSTSEHPIWSKVERLGDDQVILLGLNTSVMVSCRNFPGSKGNSIYYSEDQTIYRDGITVRMDAEIFHLDEMRVHRITGYNLYTPAISPTPIWLLTHPI